MFSHIFIKQINSVVQLANFSLPTFEFDAQLGEGLLHTLTFPLPHEAVVDMNSYHLVLVKGFVEEGCANCGVNSTTQQHLETSTKTESFKIKTIKPRV